MLPKFEHLSVARPGNCEVLIIAFFCTLATSLDFYNIWSPDYSCVRFLSQFNVCRKFLFSTVLLFNSFEHCQRSKQSCYPNDFSLYNGGSHSLALFKRKETTHFMTKSLPSEEYPRHPSAWLTSQGSRCLRKMSTWPRIYVGITHKTRGESRGRRHGKENEEDGSGSGGEKEWTLYLGGGES